MDEPRPQLQRVQEDGTNRDVPRLLVGAVIIAGVAVLVGLGLGDQVRPAPSPTPSEATSPSVGQPTVPPCVAATPTTHGGWWVEIGGPSAYFNVKPGTLYSSRNWWLITVRFNPDAMQGETVAMWAEAIPSGHRVIGEFNSRMDPKNIYNGASPAPDLPGGWYLFQQGIPTTGCWRLEAAIGGRVVGTAIIEVLNGHPSQGLSSSPNAPTPGLPSPGSSAASSSP